MQVEANWRWKAKGKILFTWSLKHTNKPSLHKICTRQAPEAANLPDKAGQSWTKRMLPTLLVLHFKAEACHAVHVDSQWHNRHSSLVPSQSCLTRRYTRAVVAWPQYKRWHSPPPMIWGCPPLQKQEQPELGPSLVHSNIWELQVALHEQPLPWCPGVGKALPQNTSHTGPGGRIVVQPARNITSGTEQHASPQSVVVAMHKTSRKLHNRKMTTCAAVPIARRLT